jgi:transcriptional regulator GlxA family with amidase domain
MAFGESPYSHLMTRRIESAMVLLRRGDLSVTGVCFTVGRSSLGTFGRPIRNQEASVAEP